MVAIPIAMYYQLVGLLLGFIIKLIDMQSFFSLFTAVNNCDLQLSFATNA